MTSGAAISLLQGIQLTNLLKTVTRSPIQLTTAKLNTADHSPMSALGMTAPHLRIAEFKFTHNLTICDQLPDTELIFGIDIQKKFSISYTWDNTKKLLHPKGWQIPDLHTETANKTATIGTIKSTIKIPP